MNRYAPHRRWRRGAPIAALALMGVLAACTESVDLGPSSAATLVIDAPRIGLQIYDTIQLTALTFNARGNPVPTGEVIWTTSDSARLHVSPSGLIAAREPGVFGVQAKAQGLTAGLQIFVDGARVKTLSMQKEFHLLIGSRAPLNRVARAADGSLIPQLRGILTVADPTIASVVNDTVQALAPGTTTITWSVEGIEASASVVSHKPATSIELRPGPTPSFVSGDSLSVAAIVSDEDGRVIPGVRVAWTTPALSPLRFPSCCSSTTKVASEYPGRWTVRASMGDSIQAEITVTVLAREGQPPAPEVYYLPHDDIIHDPALDRIYLLRRFTGEVLRVDPEAKVVDWTGLFLGAGTYNRMAVSSDGERLWVAVRNAPEIRQVETRSGRITTIPLPPGPVATDIAAHPSDPTAVIVTRPAVGATNTSVIQMVRDGVVLPGQISGGDAHAVRLAVDREGGRVFGVGGRSLTTIGLGASGLTKLESAVSVPLPSESYGVDYSAGRLIIAGRLVYTSNPASSITTLGHAARGLAMDPITGGIHGLLKGGFGYVLKTWDRYGELRGEVTFTEHTFSSAPETIWLGNNRVAAGDYNRLFVQRAPFFQDGPG